MKLVLASSSPWRLKLLESVDIIPDIIDPADVDETEFAKELPLKVAERLAKSKADAISSKYESAYIIGADTVTASGRRILPKALNDDDVLYSLNRLSGRRIRVYTGVTVNKVIDAKIEASSSKLVTTILKFKKLDKEEIQDYITSKQGLNKSGAFSIGGMGSLFVSLINGSYSNVVGLPLHQTYLMLKGLGFNKRG